MIDSIFLKLDLTQTVVETSSQTIVTSNEHLETRSNIWQYAVFGLFAILVMMLGINQITDDDVFWHLATGRWIVQHQSVPTHDVFGFVTQGEPWIPFEWGWDVVTYALYSLAGDYTLVQLLPGIVWLCIGALNFSALRRMNVATPVIVIVLLMTLFASLYSISVRPYIVSLLGFTVVGYIFFTFKYSVINRSTSKRLFILPFVFLVWTNMHPGVLAGLMYLFLILLAEIIRHYIIPNANSTIPRLDAESILKLEMVLALCVVAVVINPHGLSTFDYIYEHTKLRMLTTIKEWFSPFDATFETHIVFFYKILLVVGSTSIIYAIRNRHPIPALLYIAFALYSLSAVRFVADFAVVTAYGTGLGLNDLLVRPFPKVRCILERGVSMALVACLLLVAAYKVVDNSLYRSLAYHRHFGFGIDRHFFSEPLIAFMKAHHITGRAFNYFDIGGQLIWELPDEQNFIDSRNLNDNIAQEYFSIATMQTGFEERLDAYDIDHIVLLIPDLTKTPSNMQSTLVPYCAAARDWWKLVYWDDQSFLYLKNVPKFTDIIEKYTYHVADPYLYAFQQQTFDSLLSVRPETFQQEIRRKHTEEPNGFIVRSLAGYSNQFHLKKFDAETEPRRISN